MNQRIDVRPWVCADCGNLMLMSDIECMQTPGNCPSCEQDNVFCAGPVQKVNITISRKALPAFAKGEKDSATVLRPRSMKLVEDFEVED